MLDTVVQKIKKYILERVQVVQQLFINVDFFITFYQGKKLKRFLFWVFMALRDEGCLRTRFFKASP